MDQACKELYETFRNKVLEAVTAYYGEGYDVSIRRVTKLNGLVLYGLSILEKNKNISPTIYLEEYYDRYQNGMSFSEVFRDIIDMYEEHSDTNFLSFDFFTDYEMVKPKLAVKLINVDMNHELLMDVPYKRIEDMALVCIVDVTAKNDQIGTVLVHNNHISMWGIKADTLIKDAVKNSEDTYRVKIRKLSDMILEICERQADKEPDDYDDWLSEWFRCKNEPENMYVLTNSRQLYGSSVIAYSGVLEKIGDALGGDYYILPSSIHELIVVPSSICCPASKLNDMVCQVNSEMLSSDEILANHAYIYLSDQNKIVSILDTVKEQNEIG